MESEVEPATHVEHLLKRVEGIIPPRPAFSISYHPICQSTEFQDDVQQAAIGTNFHGHSKKHARLKKGGKSCRMRRSQPIVSETGCCQIVSFQEGNVVYVHTKNFLKLQHHTLILKLQKIFLDCPFLLETVGV